MGVPIALVGAYTTHTLKLGVKGFDAASATSNGSMYVSVVATSSGQVTALISWYMKGILLAPFLNFIGVINDAWVTVKFQAIDATTGASVEKELLHEHADPVAGTAFDAEYTGSMDISLYDGHVYQFFLNATVHAAVLGIFAATVSDFGGVHWSDSRIEWRYLYVPNTANSFCLSISASAGGTTSPAPGTYTYHYGSSIAVTASAYLDYTFSRWLLDDSPVYYNPIIVAMNSNHVLIAEFYSTSKGGGCPYVSVWNGTHYVLDNNLIPGAERSNGTDVTDYYMLQQPLIRNDGKYSLLIWDLDKHSLLDQARLLAVDHKSDINIAVSPYGEILTYRNPAALVSATDQNGQDVTSILSSVDGDYFGGSAGDYVMLDFGSLDVSKGAKLVFRADFCSPELPYCKESIHVQVSNADGEWFNASSFIPRMYWSTDIIDMSSYLPDVNGDVKVRLYFTAHHKIDYVGLDASEQGEFETRYANLAEADHSRLGDVKESLVYSDDQRAELLPSESITLEFTLPQNTEEKRDFIIVLEGHYFIIS